MKTLRIAVAVFSAVLILTSATAAGQSPTGPADAAPTGNSGQAAPTGPNTGWQAGLFVDIGYLNSFNSPSNHLFRSRGTTSRVDEVNVQTLAMILTADASSRR